MVTIRPKDAELLASAAFVAAGIAVDAAQATARALVQAEQDGLPSHGLARVPFYAAQVRTGKINAVARPKLDRKGAVLRVDADHGLAFPALEAAAQATRDIVRELGVAVVSIAHSHHFGVAGQAVEPFARDGFVALAMSNSPAAIAPWGGHAALYGTNPIAFACPRDSRAPLLIDLSLSHVARGKVMLAQKSGQPIPPGWALDAHGMPTTDADAAMSGTMLPSGVAKGAALALMVELLTAGLSGSNYAWQASSLFDDVGPAPDLGHFILVIDPSHFAPGFAARAEAMFAAIEAQDGARLPGGRRMAERASRDTVIQISQQLFDTLKALSRPATA